jgi:aspartate aminotransferase
MKEIPPSPTMSIFQLASEKKAKGETVYNFAAGDPALPNHPAILEMLQSKLKSGFVPYPPAEGIFELRKAFADWNSLNLTPDNVAVTSGGKYALYTILSTFLNPGEEVLVIAPYYVSYPAIVSLARGTLKTILAKPEKGWKISPEDLQTSASKASKFLILNNACNPTGILYTKEELHALIQMAGSLGITVISDEVYSGLVYDGAFISCGIFPGFLKDHFIIQSCSKNFAMSGWRVGFILANPDKLAKIRPFLQQTTNGVPLVSQWGALGALLSGDLVNSYVKEAMQRRLFLFVKTFSSLFPQKLEMPKSAIYAFVPLASMGIYHQSSVEVAKVLMEQANIAALQGEAFGISGYLRFACSENEKEIEEGVRKLAAFILKKDQ